VQFRLPSASQSRARGGRLPANNKDDRQVNSYLQSDMNEMLQGMMSQLYHTAGGNGK